MDKKFEMMKSICESVFDEKIYYNDFSSAKEYQDFIIDEMSYIEKIMFDKSIDENISFLYESLYDILEESVPQLKGQTLFLAVYTKAKTEKKLKEIIRDNPENPPIDLSIVPLNGPYGTPEEMREFLKLYKFNIVNTFTDSSKSFSVPVEYKDGKWFIVE